MVSNSASRMYNKLRKHLDSMPVGYPATVTGVEKKLLRSLFSPEEAEFALALTYRFEPLWSIQEKAVRRGIDGDACRRLMDSMEKKGTLFSRDVAGERQYGLLPFIVGMFEFQARVLTDELYDDAVSYLKQGFAVEYLTTAVPQMRVVPVEKSVSGKTAVATYDEIRRIIGAADDRITVADCICKKAQDIKGNPCAATEIRELCIALRDYSDIYRRQGWGRAVSGNEAMALLDGAERSGLVLQTANEQSPQFICACCSCCCGILGMMKYFPRPADFAAGNYRAAINGDSCTGCGLCAKRCPMEAIVIREKKVSVRNERCIGCGLCVTACKKGPLRLERKADLTVPPENTDDLYGTIIKGRKSRARRVFSILRAFIGLKFKQ